MDNLLWLQEWYANQSIEHVGKRISINIHTAEKSAWHIEIELKYTKHKGLSFKKLREEKTKYNWYEYEIKDKKFVGKGDFNKLNVLIEKFRELIGEIQKPYLEKDKFFDDEFQEFLFEDAERAFVHVHYVDSQEIAASIIENGFEFSSNFDRSTREVKSEEDYIRFNHYVLKSFGEYVIVLGIGKEIFKKYETAAANTKLLHTHIEKVLSEREVFIDENQEEVFTLHRKYVKGYFNYKTKQLVRNPDFDPAYDSPEFLKNLERYK